MRAVSSLICRSLLAGDFLAWHGRPARVLSITGKMPVPLGSPVPLGRSLLTFLSLAGALVPVARADWQRDDTTLAWRAEGKIVWQFSFDPAKGKTFFNPVTVAGGPSLTNFRPEDHPWHYGLWFSWKYINHTNYWEENRQSGKSAGKTSWTVPAIDPRTDGGVTIRYEVSYTNPAGRVDLAEKRELVVSAPAADGSYSIDWRAHFTAGPDGAELDRTPMPGEPGGQVNGGYAGLSIRTANAPLAIAYVSTAGPIAEFVSGRNRPNVPAVASNFSQDGQDVGAVAIFSDPANVGENAPWYLINQKDMRFMCAAILAPAPRTVAAGGGFDLRYRVAVRRAAWTPEVLAAATAAWLKPGAK